MTLADLIDEFKKARLTSRLTQRDVADATGVSTLTISNFERGALTEIGTVKLLALLQTVGLELQIRPAGHQRTLDDIRLELEVQEGGDLQKSYIGRRVRHAKKIAL